MSIRAGSPRRSWLGERRSRTGSGSSRSGAAFCDLVIGGVDTRDSGGRQRDAFRRQPLRDDEVGMTLAHQTMIGFADRAGRGVRQNPEDRVGILARLLFRAHMERPDSGIIHCIEAEMPSNLAQIGILGGENAAVGQGNVEQATEKILQDWPIGRKQAADLAGIALETGGALAGEVKHQPDMLLFARRDLKDLAKSRDFITGDDPIRPCHLGAERDNRDREGDASARVALATLGGAMRMPARNVTRRACQQRAKRAAKRQLAGSGDDSANKAHEIRRRRCERVNVNGYWTDPFDRLFHPVNLWYNSVIRIQMTQREELQHVA